MKRKLKKVLLMVSLVLMMGLVGCGVKLEEIAHFVGRQVDPSADIRVMAKVKDNVTFPKKLYGCYKDIMSSLDVEHPNNYVYFNDNVRFYFVQKPSNTTIENKIYFDESYKDLVLEFNGKRYVRGTISNIEVDTSTIKLYEIDIELNGVSGKFKYNRNAFTLFAKCDFDGYTEDGKHVVEDEVYAPLYGSFYYFSKNLRYFQVSSDTRGYFVDLSALTEVENDDGTVYQDKSFRNGIVFQYMQYEEYENIGSAGEKTSLSSNGLQSQDSSNNEMEKIIIQTYKNNVSFENEMTTHSIFNYIPNSNSSYTISVPANTFVEVQKDGKLVELKNQMVIGNRAYFEYTLMKDSKYTVIVQTYDDIFFSDEITRTERFEVFKGGINLIELYGQNISFTSNLNNIDYFARFDISGIIKLSFNTTVNIKIVDSKGNVIYNGINSKNFEFSVIKGERYSFLIERNSIGSYIYFNFTKPSC